MAVVILAAAAALAWVGANLAADYGRRPWAWAVLCFALPVGIGILWMLGPLAAATDRPTD